MATVRTANDILDREYLEIRAKVIEIAASLDRIERGSGKLADDSRLQLLQQALEILVDSGEDRAKRIQQIFSRTYEPNWRSEFGV